MSARKTEFSNPFRPGAGHMPPYLAGREDEIGECTRLLDQDTVLNNLVLTGLRGLGKTVLLETYKPIAIAEQWLWTGTDLSESTSITDENLATRLLTDLSSVTSNLVITREERAKFGLTKETETVEIRFDFRTAHDLYSRTPGLVADKLKAVLEFAWFCLQPLGKKGVVFAYDEAQNMSDHAAKEQYPLSLLLDVFQSIQRKGIPFMLVLVGLPTLFPKLVEARTYAERMFRVVVLKPLSREDTVEAISKPIERHKCPIQLSEASIASIWEMTQGYPYFVQYVCREVYDIWAQNLIHEQPLFGIPAETILRRLDSDFFAGRWARATDRQRDLLIIIAHLPNCDTEFTVQEVVDSPRNVETPSQRKFSSSHVSQMLSTLSDAGLVYRNRHGKYSFAVPLMGRFILRQTELMTSLSPIQGTE